MKHINVVGVVATDQKDRIAINGLPVSFQVNYVTRSLDQSILRSVIHGLSADSSALYDSDLPGNTLVVMGSHTHEELINTRLLDAIVSKGFIRLVSSPTGCSFVLPDGQLLQYHNTIKSIKYPEGCDPRAALLEAAMGWAYNHPEIENILVLGGNSVYLAFSEHYSVIHSCSIKDVQPREVTSFKKLGCPVRGLMKSRGNGQYSAHKIIDTPNFSYEVLVKSHGEN